MSTCTQPIDYTSRDFDSIYNDLVNLIPTFLPAWTSTSDNDFGHVLLQLYAYVGDILNYYIDRVANESYLSTAVQRGSILNIANMLGYVPFNSAPATGNVTFTIQTSATNVTIPALTQVQAVVTTGSDNHVATVTYETQAAITIAGGGTYTGTVAITEGVTYSNQLLGTSTGLAYQEFIVQRTPVIDGSLQMYVDGVLWLPVSHLVDYGANDRVYEKFTDSVGRVHILFGDNTNGAAPVNGQQITATFRIGGGSIGNVTAGSITQIATPVSGVTSVINIGATSGGSDPETNDHIRNYAPLAIRTQNRAVTLTDFASVAISQSYCSKARATAGAWNTVTVYAAPPNGGINQVTIPDAVVTASSATVSSVVANFTSADVGVQISIAGAGVSGATLVGYIATFVDTQHVTISPTPSTSVTPASLVMINRPVIISAANKVLLQAYVQNRAMVGTTVTVSDPQYIRTNVTATYQVLPQYKQSTIAAAVNAAILSLLSYDGVVLGDNILTSDVYTAILSVPGVDYVTTLQYLNRDYILSGSYGVGVTAVTLNTIFGIQVSDSIQFISNPNTTSESVIATTTVSTITSNGITIPSSTLTNATVMRITGRTQAQFDVFEIPIPGKISLTASGGVP